VSHIEGVDVGRAALEEAVGEPTGGSAGVEGPLSGGGDREAVEGGVELQSTAADEGRRRGQDEDGFVGGDEA
jgi:hypothetical protein